MKEFSDFVRASNSSDFAQTPTWNDAVSLVGSMPSTQQQDIARDIATIIENEKDMRVVLKQPRWIPCSARLPQARRSVILSTKNWSGEGCYWETTEHHVIWKGYKWNATYWDDEVIAWMPLPEPYKGE